MRMVVVGLGLLVSACAASPAPAPPQSGKIVSIDYCADQMLLKLVERNRIAAVSSEVELDRNFAAPRAVGLPRVRPNIEEILALRPAVVVKSYGGGPSLDAQLSRAGVRLVQLDYAASLADIPGNIRSAAKKLGAESAGEQTIADFNAQIAAAKTRANASAPTLLYLTPGGVTTGPGSLIDDIIRAGGYTNFDAAPGWHSLPLERLAKQQPDAVLAAFFDNKAHDQDAWSSARHPLVAQALQGKPQLNVPGSAVSCGNWLVGDVVARLAAMRSGA